jgi:hypothetical protein
MNEIWWKLKCVLKVITGRGGLKCAHSSQKLKCSVQHVWAEELTVIVVAGESLFLSVASHYYIRYWFI